MHSSQTWRVPFTALERFKDQAKYTSLSSIRGDTNCDQVVRMQRMLPKLVATAGVIQVQSDIYLIGQLHMVRYCKCGMLGMVWCLGAKMMQYSSVARTKRCVLLNTWCWAEMRKGMMHCLVLYP